MKRILTTGALVGLIAATFVGGAANASPTSTATGASNSAASAAGAGSVAAQAATPYAGSGSADLLEVDAALPDFEVTHVILSPVSTAVDSEGDPRSKANAANLDAGLIDDNIPLDEVLTQASQTAPEDNAEPAVSTLAEVPADPLLTAGVSTSTAHARWAGDGVCLDPDADIARGHNQTADAKVLNTGTAEAPAYLANLENEAGAVSATQSSIFTREVAGQDGRALVSESFTQVDEVTLLAGTPLELHIGVSETPTLTATATGSPGGASVEYNDPLVTISNPDGPLADISQLGDALDSALKDALSAIGLDVLPGLDPADPLVNVELSIGRDNLTVAEGPEVDAGTAASGEVWVVRLHITVLEAAAEPLGFPLTELNVNIGHMTAAVAVPEGGIDCDGGGPTDNPLRDVHKDVTQAEVAPGGTFDYTLTVPNRGPCTLTDVVVTDTITAPPGTTATADPPADSQDGLTFTWNVGELAPNETLTFTLTVNVPDDAPIGFTFRDDLHAEGNCDGVPAEKDVTLDLPTVTDAFQGPCDLQQSNKSASHLEVTPGQTFNYFVHVFNQGAEPCSDITVTDTLDSQVSFVSCTDDCTNAGQEVTWTGLDLGAGSGMTLTITVQTADDATGTLTNTAVIDSPDDAGGPHTVTHNGPAVTDQSVLAPPNPARLGNPQGPLPRTGGTNPMLPLAALGGAGLAALVLRRRFSTSS